MIIRYDSTIILRYMILNRLRKKKLKRERQGKILFLSLSHYEILLYSFINIMNKMKNEMII